MQGKRKKNPNGRRIKQRKQKKNKVWEVINKEKKGKKMCRNEGVERVIHEIAKRSGAYGSEKG